MSCPQQPQLVVQLAGQQAASTAGAGAWLQLSPDTMHQHRLHSQQIVLVGLCQPPEQPAAAAVSPSPSRGRSPYTAAAAGASLTSPQAAITPSRFAPSVVLLQPDQVRLVDLWARSGLMQGDTSAQQQQQQQQQEQQLPGRFLVPVSLWPCAKLPRGVALVSSSVWNGLVQPEQGASLALYTLQQPAAPAQAAQQLRVHLVRDPQQQQLLTPQHIQPTAGLTQAAAAAEASPAAGFTTPTRKTPTNKGSGGSASSSSKKTKSSSKSIKQQNEQNSQQDSKQGSTANQTNPAAQWQLQMLQAGLDWAKPRQQQLLQKLVHKQLLGQVLLPGNVVYVPLLGAQVLGVLHAVDDTTHHQQQQQQQQVLAVGGQQSLTVSHPLLQVTSSTQVQLLAPDEQQSGLQALQAALGQPLPPGQTAAAAAVAAAAAGARGTSSSDQGAGLQRRIRLAREAAAAAVDSSAQEAAMEAAERAFTAGAAAVSGGGGYGRLGGIQQHSKVLRELVMLPLQLPELFARFKLRPPRGVLLHGPPGSGKTALARAAALESGAALLVVNGPDVLTEFYGESEASLTGIFSAAAALSPSIVFIDEIDALAPSRDGTGGGGASSHTAAAGGSSGSSAAGDAAARVLTQLLVLMDGLGSSSGSSSSKSQASSSSVVAGSSSSKAGLSDSSAGASSSAKGAAGGGGGVQAAIDTRVVVIAATNRPAAVDPALRRPGRFEREIEVGVPDPAAREDIIAVRLSTVKHSLTVDDIHQLAQHTQGFVGADLAALVNEAALAALRRHVMALQQQQQQQSQQQHHHHQQQQQQESQQASQRMKAAGLCVCWQDVQAARLLVRPSALREVAVEVPQVSWDDVGGLGDVKQRLQEAVLWPQTHADALERLGATAPKGVLLYGPPGCSKTLLARAVAASSRLNFLSVKGGELYSSYVGESERAVAALFARARAAAPAVVFFDELDGLVSTRGDSGAGAGVGERVLAQLLTELDGLQARLGVVVLAATNRPDKVDPALLRPGRFDRLLLVPPPDAAARQEIFRVHTRKSPLTSDVDLTALGDRTEGYTGADISAVCREAAMAALEEDLGAVAVAARHFDVALSRVKPSSPAGSAVSLQYQQFQQQGGAQSAWQPDGEVRFCL